LCAQSEVWVLHGLAGFARLPGDFAARGDLKGRCEDAFAFRMTQARGIKPGSEDLLRPAGAAHKPQIIHIASRILRQTRLPHMFHVEQSLKPRFQVWPITVVTGAQYQ